MPRRPRVIVKTEFYYSTESECDSEYEPDESESDTDDEDPDSDVSDSEEGTDYEVETEVESDSEELDDPKPYFGKGFRVYFDSHADKKFFMQAFGY